MRSVVKIAITAIIAICSYGCFNSQSSSYSTVVIVAVSAIRSFVDYVILVDGVLIAHSYPRDQSREQC